ncbi:MAG: metal ABC transporter substrate-binding protein [Candidatus Omnitrophica bacterium]|nr:metal ABC transporter substrate-binding protein [Candidatus Omnitrophota bacterium]
MLRYVGLAIWRLKMKKTMFLTAFLMVMNTIVFAKPLKVVTTLPDFASIAEEIGKEKVTATSLMRGTQDPHYLEPTPSMAITMRDADLLIINGMELDIWVFSLINVARNPKIMYGKSGYLDVSVGIDRMEVLPAGAKADASMGHIHASGNPHYTHDPVSGKAVAKQIMERMSALSPENADYFRKNYDDFVSRIDSKMFQWREKLREAGIEKIVTYHRSWSYFARTFGLKIIGEIEPLPGIPPSPAHLSQLIEKIKSENVKVVVTVNFYDIRPAKFISERTGIRIAKVPMYVGGSKEAVDYISLIDMIVNTITGGK